MSAEPSALRSFPSRIADLGFSVELPESWQPQALPDETPDFDDGTRLFGLGAAVAPYAALVFAAAARPAYADGTIYDVQLLFANASGVADLDQRNHRFRSQAAINAIG